ncbi:MAG: hypothetical protein A2275_15215 [Bacteroidetes bacterium RIFOXYA12_FULL_35_11]|nr:MAG: hypothetical protein A2X01_18120 [Bacteroidetes bacterium GWF2_35_48]OFY80215.1 MAG: hypothetical protein A2275_15215 [Bacteroidetes bacterium RIFOXYA12_FULL_35_11]OFY96761.1 MAG: hypothetical protein A2491_09670 [Bacteroidetes bacterium RIFOXYC12_FULL_35_7]OFY97093.1 MAG: hypothetical protein A2309_01875 [Bacteroidetes bacterium RIFOXYB2_FULL_35_7]HBX51704.1 hypothetical protein [Bacteroidales bacterium]
MGLFQFITFLKGRFFKREEYDPTKFETINDGWDETTCSTAIAGKNSSATGQFQNPNLPLETQLEIVKKKLEIFDELLPNLKK